jgi:phospholipid/cholesterol/gamma-HCH transport system substrate-binding protein
MTRGRAARDLSVGAVVAVGLVIFIVAALAIGRESRLFVPKLAYWTRFENTSGLAKGSPVRLVGVQVGTVDDIEFPKDLKENRIKVVFKVDKAFAPRIRKGTVASLKSLNYLAQDKYLELTPGDPEQPVMEAGSYVEAGKSAWEETLVQSQSIADDVKEITASLRDLLVAMNRGEGIVHELIHDPEFGRQGVTDMEGSLAALRRILEGMEQGQGVAGAMLSKGEYSRRQLDNIDASVTHIKSILERLDSADSPLTQLSAPGGPGSEILGNLRHGSEALSQAADKVNNGKGLVGRLINDDDYATSILKKINSAAGHADSIMGKIDRGEGTVGGIINDPEVYESLKDIVAGIEKSRFGKGMLRHYGKKGAEERPMPEGEPSPDPGPNP